MRTVIDFQRDQGIDPWKAESSDKDDNGPLLSRDQSGVVDAHTWAALLGHPAEVTRADVVAEAYAREGAVAGRRT
jgi:hypothetical protein